MHLLPRRTRTRADERGTALVEFAFVGVIFFMLLFGIIAMSVLLALKQNMTQAASEAARSAIAVVDDTSTPADERVDVAEAALGGVVGEFDVTCDGVQAKCKAVVHECGADTSNVLAMVSNPTPTDPCLTAFIEFDNTGSNRVLPPFPIISGLEPDTFSSQSTVRLVPVPTI